MKTVVELDAYLEGFIGTEWYNNILNLQEKIKNNETEDIFCPEEHLAIYRNLFGQICKQQLDFYKKMIKDETYDEIMDCKELVEKNIKAIENDLTVCGIEF